MNLTEFLLARIAEDEAVARAATVGPWRWDREPRGEWGHQPPDLVTVDVEPWSYTLNDGSTSTGVSPVATVISSWGQDAEHIARWDPARVLAECEAKRQIVGLHRAWPVLVEQRPQLDQPSDLNAMTFRLTQQIAWTTQEEYRKRFGEEPPTAPMLRALALPYADHPDYREGWRP